MGIHPPFVARHAGKRWYLGPNRKPMRYRDAREGFRLVMDLEAQRDAEIDHAHRTGLGDHAKISRLCAAIARARGES